MGGNFLELEFSEDGTGSGGYAKVMSAEFIKAEMELFADQCREVDIVVTTALIPGKRAPILITKDMVESMKPGSVVIDLAAEQGGNCEVTRKNEVVTHSGVFVVGFPDFPSRMAKQASLMYGRNIVNVLDEMSGGKEANFQYDFDNVIVRQSTVCRNGEITFPPPKLAEPSVAPKSTALQADIVITAEKPKDRDWIIMLACGILIYAIGIPSPDSFLGYLMVFMLACIVGWKIIWNVAAALHTPLMSVTNAVSGIVVVGAMGMLDASNAGEVICAFLAATVAAINVGGGFLVTQRMLGFFVLEKE
jgi:NAD(P) transhydrogenase subunit alpha